MSIRSEYSALVDRLRVMTLYQRIEQIAVIVLSTLIAIVVVAALWNLTLRVILSLVLGETFDPTSYETFQAVFGAMFTVIIALEFKRSILVAAEQHETVFQVRIVVLLALLAVLRKFIIVDINTTTAAKMIALSGAVLALGIVYWLVRDQDTKAAKEETRTVIHQNRRLSGGDQTE